LTSKVPAAIDGGGVDKAENAASDAVYNAAHTLATQFEPDNITLEANIVAVCGAVVSPSTRYIAAILTCDLVQNTKSGTMLPLSVMGISALRVATLAATALDRTASGL
jgi:hypothetical protein